MHSKFVRPAVVNIFLKLDWYGKGRILVIPFYNFADRNSPALEVALQDRNVFLFYLVISLCRMLELEF